MFSCEAEILYLLSSEERNREIVLASCKDLVETKVNYSDEVSDPVSCVDIKVLVDEWSVHGSDWLIGLGLRHGPGQPSLSANYPVSRLQLEVLLRTLRNIFKSVIIAFESVLLWTFLFHYGLLFVMCYFRVFCACQRKVILFQQRPCLDMDTELITTSQPDSGHTTPPKFPLLQNWLLLIRKLELSVLLFCFWESGLSGKIGNKQN